MNNPDLPAVTTHREARLLIMVAMLVEAVVPEGFWELAKTLTEEDAQS